jgi:hypothetical protein
MWLSVAQRFCDAMSWSPLSLSVFALWDIETMCVRVCGYVTCVSRVWGVVGVEWKKKRGGNKE